MFLFTYLIVCASRRNSRISLHALGVVCASLFEVDLKGKGSTVCSLKVIVNKVKQFMLNEAETAAEEEVVVEEEDGNLI